MGLGCSYGGSGAGMCSARGAKVVPVLGLAAGAGWGRQEAARVAGRRGRLLLLSLLPDTEDR